MFQTSSNRCQRNGIKKVESSSSRDAAASCLRACPGSCQSIDALPAAGRLRFKLITTSGGKELSWEAAAAMRRHCGQKRRRSDT
eukprot:318168-Pleurochrysis_carterae.AAC.2